MNKMCGIIIQARMGSVRLPGKVMKKIMNKPVLELLIERLQRCEKIQRIVLATTDQHQDDPIEELASRLGLGCYRGSVEDVLGRYYEAASKFNLGVVVRITGDCPLMDPALVDHIVDYYLAESGSLDYVSNVLKPSFPDGLDIEVFSLELLKKLHEMGSKNYHREHVTTYILENPQLFRTHNVASATDLSDYRWTLDTSEDYELIRRVYEGLYSVKKIFNMQDILSFLKENPEVAALNRKFKRNEGFLESLRKEKLSEPEREKIQQQVFGNS